VPVLVRPINLVTTPDAECCSFSGLIPGVAEALSSIFVPERIAGLLTVEVRDEDDLANTRSHSTRIPRRAELRIKLPGGSGGIVVWATRPPRSPPFFPTF
jgi:hypothetical protein